MKLLRRCLAAALLVAAAGAAKAEDWPTRPVRLVVPFPAGGSTDILARLAARAIEREVGQSVVVENKGGAGGIVGSAEVSRAPADGYTLQVSSLGTHATAPLIYSNVPWDPLASFTHVAGFGGQALTLIVHPRLGVKTLAELVTLARSKPGGIDYGTSGNGTSNHLVTELFKSIAGLDMPHVAYRGSGPAANALLAGEVPTMFVTLSAAGEQVKAGKLWALAIASAERNAAYPAIPTFREQGYPDLVVTTWFGISGPPGLPAPVVGRVEKAIAAMVADPESRRRLEELSMDVVFQDSAAYTALVAAELKRWGPVVKAVGVKAD